MAAERLMRLDDGEAVVDRLPETPSPISGREARLKPEGGPLVGTAGTRRACGKAFDARRVRQRDVSAIACVADACVDIGAIKLPIVGCIGEHVPAIAPIVLVASVCRARRLGVRVLR